MGGRNLEETVEASHERHPNPLPNARGQVTTNFLGRVVRIPRHQHTPRREPVDHVLYLEAVDQPAVLELGIGPDHAGVDDDHGAVRGPLDRALR